MHKEIKKLLRFRAMNEFLKLWEKSTGFMENDEAQKKDLVLFGLLATLTLALCWTWLVFPLAIATYLSYRKCIKGGCHVDE